MRKQTWMEEAWSIEEVGFDVVGCLSVDCFLPPRDMAPCDSKPVATERRIILLLLLRRAQLVLPATWHLRSCATSEAMY